MKIKNIIYININNINNINNIKMKIKNIKLLSNQ